MTLIRYARLFFYLFVYTYLMHALFRHTTGTIPCFVYTLHNLPYCASRLFENSLADATIARYLLPVISWLLLNSKDITNDKEKSGFVTTVWDCIEGKELVTHHRRRNAGDLARTAPASIFRSSPSFADAYGKSSKTGYRKEKNQRNQRTEMSCAARFAFYLCTLAVIWCRYLRGKSVEQC